MIDADSGSILVPEDNVKQNQKEDYANKYQKHIACSYANKLFCVDDNFVRHAQVEMLFTTSLTICSIKVNTAVK